jgi:hypothetical protein
VPETAGAELAPGLALFPNPTFDGRLQVQLPGAVQGPVHYRLLSAVGSKLVEGTVNLKHAGALLQFDFSRQLRFPGLYYLGIEDNNGQQVFKILHPCRHSLP